MTPVIVSWSGGKDSSVALWELQQHPDVAVAGLLSTITTETGRIAMHGVRRELLAAQAAALGMRLDVAELPAFPSNEVYEAGMGAAFAACRDRGVETLAFGDLFLEDIRAYREALMARHRMTALYPVWGRPTGAFMDEFLAAGFRAVIVCVDLAVLDLSFAGRTIDARLLADLPSGVDPCGENGEFHTFVFDGPNFARPVAFELGARTTQDGFGYMDLVEP